MELLWLLLLLGIGSVFVWEMMARAASVVQYERVWKDAGNVGMSVKMYGHYCPMRMVFADYLKEKIKMFETCNTILQPPKSTERKTTSETHQSPHS
jgi:hypothetical protein